jgi:hypothetical protein
MNGGCLALAGLGPLSLLAFGVTLEAINDPQQLTTIPLTPWDFLTYSLIALAIVTLIHLVRRPNPHKVLARNWMSKVAKQDARIRTNLRLTLDGSAVIDTIVSKGADSHKLSTQARWQLLDNRTLHLWGTQTAAWKILKLNRWSMITADQAGAGLLVRWTAFPRVNLKPWLLIAAAVLLAVLFALSLPRSQPSHAIADDPQYVLPTTSHHGYRVKR